METLDQEILQKLPAQAREILEFWQTKTPQSEDTP